MLFAIPSLLLWLAPPADRGEPLEPLLHQHSKASTYASKLSRGRTAKLTPRRPAHRGVMLVTGPEATSIPLTMVSHSGIYLYPKQFSYAAISFGTVGMMGDELIVRCEGDLPKETRIQRKQWGSQTKTWNEDGTDGVVEATVPTTGLSNDVASIYISTPDGEGRIDRCTLTRVKP